MKRPRAEGDEGRKKTRTVSVNTMVHAKNQTQPDQQRGGDKAASIMQQLQNAKERALDSFDVQEWCNGQFSADLKDTLDRLFKEKAVMPSPCSYWHMDGSTLMNKEAVLVHYPNSPGVFQNEVKDTSDYEKARRNPDVKGQKKMKRDGSGVKSTRYYQLAVFNFETLTMYEAESGESFKVSLGDSVIVTDKVSLGTANGDKALDHDNIIRVTEIFMNSEGEFMFRGHYYYQDTDTAIAAAPKDPKKNGEMRQLPSGEHLSHPRRLWLCGSEQDNDTYENCFNVNVIDRVTKVYQIAPGPIDADQVPPELKDVFDPKNDWFYNAHTVRAFISVEDIWEDWMPWSPLYKALWQREGPAGIKRLRESCGANFTKLMRGASCKKLNRTDDRELYIMELFAGGGGISHICRKSEHLAIRPGWANDINQAACATYNCNEPEAYVFCQGLEELLQLLIKWGREVDKYLGAGWQDKLKDIRQGGPQHKFSRQHMPKGVGCYGSTMGKPGTSANVFVAAAKRGWEALKAAGLEDGDGTEDDEPDWDALLSTLESVVPKGEYVLPQEPLLEGTEVQQTATKVAFDKAIEWQQQRIQQCKQRVQEQELGKVLEVRDVRVTDCAVRVKHGSSRNQLDAALTDYECWLEYEVRRQGSSDWEWEHQSLLWDKQAVQPMRHFMLRMLADKAIPMPGDVGLLTGGPPCQNVSGLNRHAKQQQVLKDPKNRLVMSYVRITQYLKPPFILMEQVTDVFRKENALYARYALQQMVEMDYQCRAGICSAGNYGCPQGRRRAVFLGALSGQEQLPAFPQPTHVCKDFNMGFPKQAQHCEVETLDKDRKYPMVVIGDVLTDLPDISNFEESDKCDYIAGGPKSITQAFLRRNPPEHGRSLAGRCTYADAAMAPWQKIQLVAGKILQDGDRIKVLEVGRKVLCKNKGRLSTAAPKGAKKNKPNSKKATPAPTPAATPAASSDQAEGAKDAADEEEEQEEEQEDAALALAVDEDDEDADAAQEVIECAKDIAESKNFAIQTWQQHLSSLTEEAALQDVMNLIDESEQFTTMWLLGKHRLDLLSHAAQVAAAAPLRDHRPLLCNADDYNRICAVPKEKGANFRDMPGVITHANGTCCSGSWHAMQKPADGKQHKLVNEKVAAWKQLSKEEQAGQSRFDYIFDGITLKCACGAGGMPPQPPLEKGKSGNDKNLRVDHYGSTAQGAWRGSHKPECPSVAFWMSTGDLVCPRWCVTYKKGVSNGRHGCFGRAWFDDIQPTVVTRAEPHNLQLIHPLQDRVLSIRENARCQGFPDYHVFIGLGSKGRNGSHGKGAATVDERYMQIGNAVSPMLSACLGECLCLAAAEESPVGDGMIMLQLPEYEETFKECQEKGLRFWCQEEGNTVDMTPRNDFYWFRHNPEKKAAAEARAASGGGKKGAKKGAAPEPTTAEGPAEASNGEAALATSSKAAAEGAAAGIADAAGDGTAVAGSSKAAAAAATSGGGKSSAKQRKTTTTPAVAHSNAAGGGAAGAGAEKSGAAAVSDAAKSGAAKRRNSSTTAEPAAAATAHEATAAPAAKRHRSNSSTATVAAGKSGGTGAASGGRNRPHRKCAAAAEVAVRDQLELERTPVREHRAKLEQLQQHRSPQKDADVQKDTANAVAAALENEKQAVDGMVVDEHAAAAGGGEESGSRAGATSSSNHSSDDVLEPVCGGHASMLAVAV